MPDRRPDVAVVVLAGGSGARAGHQDNKVLRLLGGQPVFAWSLRTVASIPDARRLVLVVAERDRSAVEQLIAPAEARVEVVTGGATRHESEWQALQALAPDIDAGSIDVVVIHDAARPLATSNLFTAVIDAANKSGGAVPVRRQHAVVAAVQDPGQPAEDADLVAVQTPQAFRAAPLLAAYRAAHAEGFRATDTASCVERYSDLEVRGVPGSAENVKITFPGDLDLAQRLHAGQSSQPTA